MNGTQQPAPPAGWVAAAKPITGNNPGGFPDQCVGCRTPWIQWSTQKPIPILGQGQRFQQICSLPVLGFSMFKIQLECLTRGGAHFTGAAYRVYGRALGK